MISLYNLSVFFYGLSIRMAALFGNVKAKQWVEGRKDLLNKINQTMKAGEERVWFHCASLGEFEQGRPVIEKFKIQNSKFKIVLTFFSPSGYEMRKIYAGADYVFYLPLDTAANAEKFISLINPAKVFFVKYEYWHHYLNKLKEKNIDISVISAIFRREQVFFQWYGGFFRNMLKKISFFFVQDESSAKLLESIGIKNYSVTGDTRFDRVAELAKNVKAIPLVEKFKGNKKVLIAGSTWHEDENIIAALFGDASEALSHMKIIIAPHEVSEEGINALVFLLNGKAHGRKVLRYSQADENNIPGAAVLIIDSIGMLSSLYQYGDIAFIGGGFGKGIHNILEAAAFGMPVFFGPNYQKFREAKELIAEGAAFSYHSNDDFRNHISTILVDDEKRIHIADIAKQYVLNHTGATEKILGRV